MIGDFTKNEFDNRNYDFNVKEHKNGKYKLNGFEFTTLKNGHINGGELINGNLIRRVQLPQSYFNKANSIFSEIKNEANIALEAQRRALVIKEKYKNKICKDSVKVDFMDNDEYKGICKEDEKIAKLKTKIDAKLAQIEQQKQQKRTAQNQQRLVQARESEAIAAQMQASAAEEANNQQAWNNINQSIQNMNSNMQMQQLNNNLMQYNYMPKRYDVYLH
jgi:vacuolar-type H+-ATPase subunit I/STV1